MKEKNKNRLKGESDQIQVNSNKPTPNLSKAFAVWCNDRTSETWAFCCTGYNMGSSSSGGRTLKKKKQL